MVANLLVLQVAAQFDALEAKVRKDLAMDEPYRAIAHSGRALARTGAPPIFHVLRADAYNRIGEYGKSAEQLKRAAATLSQHPEFKAGLIGCYTGLGHLDSAMALVDPVVPEQVSEELAFRAGRVHAIQRRWSEAFSWFDAGLKRHPDSVRLLRERGGCHAMLGDSARARVDLDRAIQLSPRQAASYNSRGYYLYMLSGDHRRAIADMDRAIKHDPNYGYAFSNRGWCHYELGDVARARRDLELAVRKNPGNAYAHRSLGIIAVRSGDLVAGCGRLHRALSLGFTAQFGPEVEELVRTHCSSAATPAPATVVPAPAKGLPGNAPAEPGRDRSNAP